MKSFTQRWREASDEAEDQPMEDTPTDPKEAPDQMQTLSDAITELRAALAAQTERADKMEAERNEARQLLDKWQREWRGLRDAVMRQENSPVINFANVELEANRLHERADRLQRKERDEALRGMVAGHQRLAASYAKCAELEKDLSVTEAARRKWVDAAHDRRVKMEELERLASKAIHSLTKTLSNESLRNDSVERATVLFDAQRSSDKMRALLTPAPPEEKRP